MIEVYIHIQAARLTGVAKISALLYRLRRKEWVVFK